MTLYKIIRITFLQDSISQVFVSGCRFRFLHPETSLQLARLSTVSPETDEPPEVNATKKRKVIKVAILGRPNAGKSTFINRILNKPICDVSRKTHTTRQPLKAALTVDDTQIVFVDTPGIVTKQESKRFHLSESFIEWKKRLLNEVDIVGVIHEAQRIRESHNFSMKLIHCLHDLPETTPMFLIINKIDLIKDKGLLIKASKRLLGDTESQKTDEDLVTSDSKESSQDLAKNVQPKKPNFKERFSKVFYVSALQNVGVGDIVMYLLEQAKEGEWMLPTDKQCDTSLQNLILNLIRAQLMDCLPHALPYSLKFQIELLEENDLGQIACVAIVKCQRGSTKAYLLTRKLNRIKKIAKKLESDLYNIFQKDFRITIVVADKEGRV